MSVMIPYELEQLVRERCAQRRRAAAAERLARATAGPERPRHRLRPRLSRRPGAEHVRGRVGSSRSSAAAARARAVATPVDGVVLGGRRACDGQEGR